MKVAVDDAVQVDELSARRGRGRQHDRRPDRRRRGHAPLRRHLDRRRPLPLARRIADVARACAFMGLTGYEGHCSLEFDETKRHAMAREAMALLTGIAADLAAAGLPCQIVSAAGTGHLGDHLAATRA